MPSEVYIGTKVVLAEPMDQSTFNEKFKPFDGKLTDRNPGYKVQYEDGYISWSPKDIFERCYRKVINKEADMLMIAMSKPQAGKGGL